MRIVVALGGNALLERGDKPDAAIEHRHVRRAAQALVPLAAEHELVVCHGNGPQVGLLAVESEADPALTEPYPLDALGAQTQGLIGYWLAQEMHNAGAAHPAVAVVTQTVVDSADPAFEEPSKFIGRGYHHHHAVRLATEHGWDVRADGELWRRVVPSPEPQRIVELPAIRTLLAVGVIPICAGGGGAPVVENYAGELVGVEAVVDKDLGAALLARDLYADALLLLTDVPAVYRDFGTEYARPIDRLALADLDPSSFPAGSMRPKLEAAARFVGARRGRAAIGALADAAALLAGTAGTAITATADVSRTGAGPGSP